MKFLDNDKYQRFIQSIPERSALGAICDGFFICFRTLFPLKETKIDWNKYPDPMIQDGLEIMKRINFYGFEAYVVGGMVRDIVMGNSKPDDFDIATNMPLSEIKEVFNTDEFKTIDVGGEEFGQLKINYNDRNIDIALFRSEYGFSDARRPDSVTIVNDFKTDASRRDFAYNSLGADVDGNIKDYFGGIEDIKNGIIRTVGNPEERFREDYLRMIRALRFSARYNHRLDEQTLEAIMNLKEKIVDPINPISVERIKAELVKGMKYGGESFARFLTILNNLEISKLILPEIDIGDYEITSIINANDPEPLVNFSIMFHQLNKEKLSKLTERFKLSTTEKECILFVTNQINSYHKLDELRKEDALAFINNRYFPIVRKVYIGFNGGDIKNYDKIIKTIKPYGKVKEREKEITQIMQKLNISAGINYGKIKVTALKWLFEEFENGNEPTTKELEKKINETYI